MIYKNSLSTKMSCHTERSEGSHSSIDQLIRKCCHWKPKPGAKRWGKRGIAYSLFCIIKSLFLSKTHRNKIRWVIYPHRTIIL